MTWGFYGRTRELDEVRTILARRRWFFSRITGRRRIGKTTLVQRLMKAEGYGLERLVAQLYEERSRKSLGDFSLTERMAGYWNRGGTELDLVALNGDDRTIRLGTCKRNADRLIGDLAGFDGHIARFLAEQREYQSWTVEKVASAPRLSAEQRAEITQAGYIPQDLNDLTTGL